MGSGHDITVRSARKEELGELLQLYGALHTEDLPLPPLDDLERIWLGILRDPKMSLLVGEVDGVVVTSCALAIIPNLTRGCRPYGVVENVVTHGAHRKRGYGTAVIKHALQAAWDAGCYKVMLLTGRKDPATLRFYEQCGFRTGVKTGFIATPPDAGGTGREHHRVTARQPALCRPVPARRA